MLEHHFWENFRKWVPHQAVDEVYDIEKIGVEGEKGFVVLLRPDHFQRKAFRMGPPTGVGPNHLLHCHGRELPPGALGVRTIARLGALDLLYQRDLRPSDEVPGRKLPCFGGDPPLFYLRNESDGRHLV